jgi:hypothetical protein
MEAIHRNHEGTNVRAYPLVVVLLKHPSSCNVHYNEWQSQRGNCVLFLTLLVDCQNRRSAF